MTFIWTFDEYLLNFGYVLVRYLRAGVMAQILDRLDFWKSKLAPLFVQFNDFMLTMSMTTCGESPQITENWATCIFLLFCFLLIFVNANWIWRKCSLLNDIRLKTKTTTATTFVLMYRRRSEYMGQCNRCMWYKYC